MITQPPLPTSSDWSFRDYGSWSPLFQPEYPASRARALKTGFLVGGFFTLPCAISRTGAVRGQVSRRLAREASQVSLRSRRAARRRSSSLRRIFFNQARLFSQPSPPSSTSMTTQSCTTETPTPSEEGNATDTQADREIVVENEWVAARHQLLLPCARVSWPRCSS